MSGVMLFVPKLMFNADGMTLDEYHRDDLLASLTGRGAEVHVVSTMPHELFDTLEHILGITPANSTIPLTLPIKGEQMKPIVAVVGRPNVGKSTLR